MDSYTISLASLSDPNIRYFTDYKLVVNPIHKSSSISELKRKSNITVLSILLELLNNESFYTQISNNDILNDLLIILLSTKCHIINSFISSIIKIETTKLNTAFRDNSPINVCINKLLKPSFTIPLKPSIKTLKQLIKPIHKSLTLIHPNLCFILHQIKCHSTIPQTLSFLFLRIICPSIINYAIDNANSKQYETIIGLVKQLQSHINNIVNHGIETYANDKIYIKIYNTIKYIPPHDKWIHEDIDIVNGPHIAAFIEFLKNGVNEFDFLKPEIKMLIKNHCSKI